MGNISFSKNPFFLLFLLSVVLNDNNFFPWGHKVPKHMIASGKTGGRNQVSIAFSFSFACEFLI
jgi:hypothetical protein